MTEEQFKIIDERLKRIEALLTKPKRQRQKKITEALPLEEQLKPFTGQYAPSLLTDFTLYWGENDRWEKEKVFDISKRLLRWQRQADKWQREKENKQQIKQTVELPREDRSKVTSGYADLSQYTKRFKI